MNNAAQKIEATLQNNTALQAVLQGKQFWELAPDNTKGVYVTYRIRENFAGATKNRRNYDTELYCFGATLTESAALSELVKTALELGGMYFRGAESGYVDDETKEGFVKVIFTFNT